MNIDELRNKNIGVVLCSSFFGFFAHTGFISALENLGIKPIAYAGTSAGALISAFAAAGMNSTEMEEHLLQLRRADFWDPDYLGLVRSLPSGLNSWSGLLKGDLFRDKITSLLPVDNFESCPKRCCIVSINLSKNTPEIFRHGSLIDAVCAS